MVPRHTERSLLGCTFAHDMVNDFFLRFFLPYRGPACKIKNGKARGDLFTFIPLLTLPQVCSRSGLTTAPPDGRPALKHSADHWQFRRFPFPLF